MQEKLGLAFKVGVYPGRGPKEAAAGAGDPMELGKGMRLPPPPGAGQPTKQKRRPPPRRGGTVNKTEAACRPGKTKNEPIGRQHVYPKSSDIACALPGGGGTVNKAGAACRPGKTKTNPIRRQRIYPKSNRYRDI